MLFRYSSFLSNKLQAAPVLPNLTNFTDSTYSSLVLCLVLATIESAGFESATTIDGRV
jgi:hypothetical protein